MVHLSFAVVVVSLVPGVVGRPLGPPVVSFRGCPTLAGFLQPQHKVGGRPLPNFFARLRVLVEKTKKKKMTQRRGNACIRLTVHLMHCFCDTGSRKRNRSVVFSYLFNWMLCSSCVLRGFRTKKKTFSGEPFSDTINSSRTILVWGDTQMSSEGRALDW